MEASDDEIKRAFRQMARRHHPDMHQDPAAKRSTEVRFKEILHAYETLKDPLARRTYDTSLDAPTLKTRPEDDPWSPSSQNVHRRARSIIEAVATIEETIYTTLAHLSKGWRGKVTISRTAFCSCLRRAKRVDRSCGRCDGRGYDTYYGRWTLCHNCAGNGAYYTHSCSWCYSSTRLYKDETITVTAPPWIRPGEHITLAEGHLHPCDTTRGTLRLTFYTEHRATLRGDDVIFKIFVTPQQAREGIVKIVKGISESFRLTIPPRTKDLPTYVSLEKASGAPA